MPNPTPHARKAPSLLAPLSLLTLFAAFALIAATPAPASQTLAEPAAEPFAVPAAAVIETAATAERGMTPAPVRHLLVKAIGQGSTPQEAEDQAVQNARALAAKYLSALGGVQALPPKSEGAQSQRVVNLKHFPAMGFGSPRAVVLLELRLRGQAEPLPAEARLVALRASAAGGVLTLEANRSCEAVAAYSPTRGPQPEFLAGVQTFRLSPGKPVKYPLPAAGVRGLSVLACTGGLSLPVDPATFDEAFAKARVGRPRPSQLEGVVSDCVQLRLSPAHDGQAPRP